MALPARPLPSKQRKRERGRVERGCVEERRDRREGGGHVGERKRRHGGQQGERRRGAQHALGRACGGAGALWGEAKTLERLLNRRADGADGASEAVQVEARAIGLGECASVVYAACVAQRLHFCAPPC